MAPSVEATEALRFFMHAKRFRVADEHLRREKAVEIFNVTALASIVMSAFASELYLKCLLVIEGAKPSRIHDLLELYRRLAPASRAAVAARWDSAAPRQEALVVAMERSTGSAIPRDLESNIAMGARAFEELRYPREKTTSAFFLSDLPRILEQVILDARPEWRRIVQAAPVEIDVSGGT